MDVPAWLTRIAMNDEFSVAQPAFDPDEALQRLQRELRALGLAERNAVFERRGVAIARARVDGQSIAAARVRRPSRTSPEWQVRQLGSAAHVRDFVADLKKQMALWSDSDD